MPTNYDRIKAMSVEEMAEFLLKVNTTIPDCMIIDCNQDGNCESCFKKWLESEAEK